MTELSINHFLTTIVENDRLARKTHAGMAYFAGSGPVAICEDCSFMAPSRGKNGTCHKYTELMSGIAGPPFPKATRACKYFTAK